MNNDQLNRKNKIWNSIITIISIFGLFACIVLLFPQVRRELLDMVIEKTVQREIFSYQSTLSLLLSFAMGGICFILFFNYCILTNSGRSLVQKTRMEIKDCLSDIEFKHLLKPVLLMSFVYLLGMLTIIRANFSYMDDVEWALSGGRNWFNWSRYIIVLLSYFVQPEISMTDISPITQLLAILILSCSSVLLVYIIGKKKITIVRLLATIPLGLSPYILECLSYKFAAAYMALSILMCIIPFLFIGRKKAFLFTSVISLLILCMIYQIASGIYLIIALMLCFQYWNCREKTNKEILSTLGITIFAFCLALLIFRFFLIKPVPEQESLYVSSAIHPLSRIISGTFGNIIEYATTIYHDFGIIWKICILLILLLFICKSMYRSIRKKILSFFVSIMFIVLSFIFSFGISSLLTIPLYAPRALLGFGVFLAILCVYIVSEYKKISKVVVLALSWCFFVFAFSYGNALADQARYAEFRIGILLHDLSALYPNRNMEDMSFNFSNMIDHTPSIKNIAKQYPVIEKLVPRRLGFETRDILYSFTHFNFAYYDNTRIKLDNLNLPVVLDSYYHTIKSDGEHILILLKH